MILYIFSGVFYLVLLMMCIPAARPWLKKLIHTPESSFHQKYAPLDALRGGAALWVVCGHMHQFPDPVFAAIMDVQNWCTNHGIIVFSLFWRESEAVPIFAVLSGYLIYKSASGIENDENLRNYVIRRILRIYPVFAAVILLFWIVGRMPAYDLISDLTAGHAFGNHTFTNPITWSLFPEMCFYFAAPILAAYRGRKWNALVYLVVAYTFAYSDPAACREYALWKYFLIGILLVEVEDMLKGTPKMEWLNRWGAWVILIIGMPWLFVEVFDLFHIDGYLGYTARGADRMTFGLGLATACVVFSSVRIRLIGRLCSFYFVEYLAAISYSLYVSHPLLIILAYPKIDLHHIGIQYYTAADQFPTVAPFFLLAIPAALGLATIIHVLVEAPAMRYRPISARKRQESPILAAT